MNPDIFPIETARFRPFGRIIQYPHKEKKGSQRNLWRVVHTEKARVGWRIAYLVLRDKTIGRLECHPFSDESFEPVKGKALLFVSRKPDLAAVRCFLLDRPVIVKKGIWHGLVSLSAETEIKITENASVACRYWPIGRRVRTSQDIKQIRQKRA